MSFDIDIEIESASLWLAAESTLKFITPCRCTYSPHIQICVIAAAVCRLLEDESERLRLGTAASKTAFSRFQPQQSADALTRIYESVTAIKKNRGRK